MNTRDKIHSAINEHIDVDDTYAYFLTRDKSSFSVGTVTLDDFEEWTDSDVADLTDSIMKKINIELNENQQVVLDWLKRNSNALKVPMLAIYELAELADENVRVAYRQIDRKGEFQVLAAFAEWGMKNDQ
jgi:hypothetical protein